MTRAARSTEVPADKAWLAQVDPDTGEMVQGDGPGGFVEVEVGEDGNPAHQPLQKAQEEPQAPVEEPVQPGGEVGTPEPIEGALATGQQGSATPPA